MKHNVDVAQLRKLYCDEGLTGRQIAVRLGVPSRTISRYLRRFGVPLRNAGKPTISVLADRQWLMEEYVGKRRSTPQIALEAGCSPGIVSLWLRRHGIKARSSGSEKGHSRTTDEARLKMSAARRGKMIGPANPNWRGGIMTTDPDRGRYRYKVWTRAVKDRDGWKCVECGATGKLHSHHIKRWSRHPELRYDIANGKTLCPTCHAKAHGRGYEFPWLWNAKRPTSASAP